MDDMRFQFLYAISNLQFVYPTQICPPGQGEEGLPNSCCKSHFVMIDYFDFVFCVLQFVI